MSNETQEIIYRIWVIGALAIFAIVVIGSMVRYAKWATTALLSFLMQQARKLILSLLHDINEGTKHGAAFLQWTTLALIKLPRLLAFVVAPAIWRFIEKRIDKWAATKARKRQGFRNEPDWQDKATAQDQASEAKTDTKREAPADDACDQQEASSPQGNSAYEEALAVLGLTGVAPLTNVILKARYAELIRLVHPDKGCPSLVFAQQVNAAVMLIRRTHGWR